MNRYIINCKKINFIMVFVMAVIFISTYSLEAAEDKDKLFAYIKDVSTIMTKVDITIRNIGLNYLSMTEGVKHMNNYVAQLELVQHPEGLSRLHKTIQLSFKKLRMGLLLFSIERKDMSIKLIKSGTRLLKYAAKDILDIGKREGIIKRKQSEEGGL